MKLTAKIKLNPTDEQRQLLHQTLQTANAACNTLSDTAWETQTFSQFKLHKLTYYDIRADFGLSAQMVIRALGKVADSYKLDRKRKRTFSKHGAFPFDERILKFHMDDQAVSIRTLTGREIIPFQAGEHPLELLRYQQGQSDLAFKRGEFYIYATCDVPEQAQIDPIDYMGVDLGIVNIATTDDGQHFSGSHVNKVRMRNLRLRQKLQKKSTKSAKRLLKKRSKREQRFAHDVNHCISKALVTKAQRTGRGISLEDLTGIRERVRLRKPQRTQLHSWSFHDLAGKIAYKAQLNGIPVIFVDPAYTSQRCSQCGHTSRSNRVSQSCFLCTSCGFSAHADVNGAVNIRVRGTASVNTSYAVSDAGTVPT